MTYEFDGLPLHILLVHAVVVIVPLTALCTAATMVWPMARRRLGLVTPSLGIACLVLVFVTMKAGEWLLLRVAQTPAILQHANDGRTLLPWAWALMGAAVVAWFWHRLAVRAWLRARIGPRFARAVAVLVTVAVLLACFGITADVAVIGEAGSRAVWGGLLGS